MAFQQLYYTSCETGLAGYGGYQFNAVTPGTSPVVMREVEERSVYEPPRWLLADPSPDEPEAYPVVLSYWTSETVRTAIVVHVAFAGTDYSGRPGNYFAHALVTSTPGPDFGPLLPAELWGAELWHSRPIEANELAPLRGPLPRGVIDRPGVQAFLDARGTERLLPELLTAVGRAMSGDRPVLLANDDANENIWWIAAVSYLLGEHLAPGMAFTTYSHRPGYSAHHLIGVVSDALPPDAGLSFRLFDLDTGRTPGGSVHPLGALLARTGVIATDGLWRQATAFASGTEQGLDDWLGPVAAAAGVLGGRLSASEVEAVARWLPGVAGRMPAQHTDVILGVALAQQDAALPTGCLFGLLELARLLPSSAHAGHLERLLLGQAAARLARGEPFPPVRFTSPAAGAAQEQAAVLLHAAAAPAALAVLEWAAASGVALPERELERYGQTVLAPDTPGPVLARMVRASPAILRGLIARLAHEPPRLAEEVLSGPAGAAISEDDLASYPRLAETRVLVSVDQGKTEPLQAFDQIVDIRTGAARSPHLDAALLTRLWSAGCPPGQIAELLDAVTPPAAADIREWFVTEIEAAADQGIEAEGWLTLARTLGHHWLLPTLPGPVADLVRNTARLAPELKKAHSAVHAADASGYAGLYAEYATADDHTRVLLRRELAALLYSADPLAGALHRCPDEIIAAFCQGLGDWLAPQRADVLLASRVFRALTDPHLPSGPADQLALAFDQVREWRRRDLSFLRRVLARDPEVARQFQLWRDSHRGGLTRKLFGGRAGSPGEG